MAVESIGNAASRPVTGSVPGTQQQHVEAPSTSRATRGPAPEGMPGNRVGGPAAGGPAGGRPRVPLAALQCQTQANLNDGLAAGLEMQREMAMAQTAASLEGFAIGAVQQQINAGLHQAETAIETAIKGQNKASDAAKEAI